MKIITGIISNTKIVFSAFFILFVLYLIAVLFFGVPFIESLGVISGIVTILTAVVTYVIWLNTKKLIEKRKMEKISVNNGDVIVAISLSYQAKNIEQDIISSGIPELQSIIDGGEPIDTGSSDNLIPENKHIHLTKTRQINRGLLISGEAMPCANENELEDYIDEFRASSRRVYEIVSKGMCPNDHLFIYGPIELSGLFVPYFVNKMNVLTYHWDLKSKKYCYLGPIDNRDVDK